MKKRLLNSEPIRFCIVGTIATIIHYGLYLPLSSFLKLNAASSIGFIVSFICNFLLSNYYTFHTRPTWKRAIRFSGSHVVNYIMQISFFNLFLFFGVSKAYAPMPVWAVIMPINFLLVRFALKPHRKHISVTSPQKTAPDYKEIEITQKS